MKVGHDDPGYARNDIGSAKKSKMIGTQGVCKSNILDWRAMRTVFYLEDDPDVQAVTSMFLELELPPDFEIRQFMNLGGLKDALTKSKPHLVLSDLNVPDAGPQEILQVLSQEIDAQIPVIITSGDLEAIYGAKQTNPRFHFFPKGREMAELTKCLQICGVIHSANE